jgi:hypothetical protein
MSQVFKVWISEYPSFLVKHYENPINLDEVIQQFYVSSIAAAPPWGRKCIQEAHELYGHYSVKNMEL